MIRRLFVAGGAGFIGSNFIRHVLRERPDASIVNFDALTYAGNLDNLRDVKAERYHFVQGNVADAPAVAAAMSGCDAVVNFAAESHVDRSIMDASDFIETNVRGVHNVLSAARDAAIARVLHVSTDEVYGPSTPDRPCAEDASFRPRSPYAASKAAGDLLCTAFVATHSVPVVLARPVNNIGPYQHLEKAVPLFITSALEDEPLPVYGRGEQVRDRLYVEDCVRALLLLLERGEPGEAYNIEAGNYRANIDVARAVLDLLDKPYDLIQFVEDREGHDSGYYVDSTKIRALGWAPERDFAAALQTTVRWYADNRWWWERIRAGEFRTYFQRQYGRRLAAARRYSG
jgi:dTDP-glucose 4,6-dehydratase